MITEASRGHMLPAAVQISFTTLSPEKVCFSATTYYTTSAVRYTLPAAVAGVGWPTAQCSVTPLHNSAAYFIEKSLVYVISGYGIVLVHSD